MNKTFLENIIIQHHRLLQLRIHKVVIQSMIGVL